MKEKCVIKRSCSFYISDMHFATMLMPFIKKQVENKINVTTFLENNYSNNIELVLARMKLQEEQKKQILNINWKENKNNKYSNIDKLLKNNILKGKENVIIINGKKEYLEIINDMVRKFLDKNSKKYEDTTIFIMDFYEVGTFNENITEILNKHEFIFNT
jgi:hypothetical protein